MMRHAISTTMVFLLAAGCGHGPATRFLTLDVPPPAQVRTDYRGPPLRLAAVHVPAILDRPEFVDQPAAGTLRVSATDRWSAPLGRLVRDTLIRDLTVRLPAGAVLPPDAAAGDHVRNLDVTILSIARAPDGLVLDAEYRLDDSRDARWRTVRLSGPLTSADSADTAISLANLLARLADQLTVAIGG